MRLYDIADVMRSKNAGPFTLTVDIVFADLARLDTVLKSPSFTPARIADLYSVAVEAVRIQPFRRVRTIKVCMPRPDASSGAPGDTDVYGCQQHFPLAGVEIGCSGSGD